MKLFLEIIVQTFLSFFTILFITRLLGRQQVSQLTFFEYINGITFGSIAATLATDLDGKTWQHFCGLILFGVLTGLISIFTVKSRTFSKVIDGEPLLVIQNGKILENNLKRSKYTLDELNILLRQQQCFSAGDISYGLLESTGQLSIIKKGDKREVTLGDLKITPQVENIPTEIIIGGQIIYDNLRKRNLTGKDLLKKLNKSNIKKIEEVMYATIDPTGKMYIDKYEDNINKRSDLSENNKNI